MSKNIPFRFSVILTIVSFVYFSLTQILGQSSYKFPKNSIKLSVLPIFIGEVNVNYERILTKKIASEVAVGFVTDNYLMNFLSESNAITANRILLGPSFGYQIKYYPFVPGDELYIDLEFKYRRYRQRYTQDAGAVKFDEYTEKYIPRIGVGFHHFLDEHLFLDFSGNLGLTFQNSLKFSNDQINHTIKLNFGAGLKFGYVF